MTDAVFAHSPARIRLGDLEVTRLGYGAMRIPGNEVWGEPESPETARAVLKRAVELGVDLIDTAWYYGPWVANRFIVETLYPYPKGLVIATKLGGKRLPDKSWVPALSPEELRKGCEDDLRTLRLDRLDIVHLRTIGGSGVPFEESLDAMIALKNEGKIRHLALSNVTKSEIELALSRTPIVSVQNLYNVAGGLGPMARHVPTPSESADVALDLCTEKGIAYMPFFPLAIGNVGKQKPALAVVAKRHGASESQIAIAWLLARSKVMLPIPGTSSVAHLEENWKAREIRLTEKDLSELKG